MFSRNFMKVFPIRKYANITAKAGSISTDMWMVNQNEIRFARPLAYLVVTSLVILIFQNFHTFDELIGTVTRPVASTFYESAIPEEVRIPNESIIAGFEAIQKMKQLQKTLTNDK